MTSIQIRRHELRFLPDCSRVLMRSFIPADRSRLTQIIGRALALSEEETERELEKVRREFSARHRDLDSLLLGIYRQVEVHVFTHRPLSPARRLLIGALFSGEYALEAAALFNPSIVPHPDQSGLEPGSLRFILSLRATGEGHISSVTFRTGFVDATNDICVRINPPTRCLSEPRQVPSAFYEKPLFERKLYELGLTSPFSRRVLGELLDTFTMEELHKKLESVLKQVRAIDPESVTVAKGILLLAQSNYEVQFASESRVSERVIFPTSPSQSNGIEDARFVLFENEDGTRNYYATYTAYDGKLVLPQLLETPDFLHFKFITFNGPAVQNKGMALFPRKINGLYAMLSRQDNENIYFMYSDNIHFWYEAELLLKPTFPWEFVQLGNCGSPMETEAGWLVLSHGVGPMRKYCVGAFLLDLEDPTKVLGRLREPLLKPIEQEREGYVPNVVYSCGALLHKRELILPYAMSDYATNFATIALDEILAAME